MQFHKLNHVSTVTISATICAGIISCKDHKKTEDNTLTFPNIVYILADDLGYGDVKINNPESKIPTPNIDKLASEGIRFTDGHSPADLYQIESPGGYYGNNSEFTERIIPRKVKGRPFEDQRTFKYVVDDYNEYFLNQLFELLTDSVRSMMYGLTL